MTNTHTSTPTAARIAALDYDQASEELAELEDAGLERSPLADALRLHILAITGREAREVKP